MKKNVILVMLLLAGAGSMTGQEISEAPIMVVTGNVVNTGVLISKGPIDLRANTEKNSKIDNTGDIQTPALTVGSDTELNNEGNICVGCVPEAWPANLLLTDAAKDYNIAPYTDNDAGFDGSMAKTWTFATNNAGSGNYWASYPATGGTPVTGTNLMVSRYVYSSDAQVLSTTAGSDNTTAAVDLSTLSSGITWADAVKKCANLTEGGYTDWYLPNSMELGELSNAKLLGYYKIFNRTFLFYWSSTEQAETHAWNWASISGGTALYNADKTYTTFSNATYVARCVRRT